MEYHHQQKRKATLTAVQPPGRYGAIGLEANKVTEFMEKPDGDGGWINGGYFVLEPSVINLINNDSCIWEQEPLGTLAKQDNLGAYFHDGFWQPMDTLRDRQKLEELGQPSKLRGRYGNDTRPLNRNFWHGKRVLLTGHTGFKGSWLGLWLTEWEQKLQE